MDINQLIENIKSEIKKENKENIRRAIINIEQSVHSKLEPICKTFDINEFNKKIDSNQLFFKRMMNFLSELEEGMAIKDKLDFLLVELVNKGIIDKDVIRIIKKYSKDHSRRNIKNREFEQYFSTLMQKFEKPHKKFF